MAHLLICLSLLLQNASISADAAMCKSLANSTASPNGPGPLCGESSPCSNVVDVAFVVDESGSICQGQTPANNCANWRNVVDFVADLAGNLTVGPQHVVLSFIGFSGGLTPNRLLLDPNRSGAEFAAAVRAFLMTSGGTNTNLALQAALEEFNFRGRSTNSTSRMVIVLTDGLSNNAPATAATAASMQEQGIVMAAVGLGPLMLVPGSNAWNEVNALAGRPDLAFHIEFFQLPAIYLISSVNSAPLYVQLPTLRTASIVTSANVQCNCIRYVHVGNVLFSDNITLTVLGVRFLRICYSSTNSTPETLNGAEAGGSVCVVAPSETTVFSLNIFPQPGNLYVSLRALQGVLDCGGDFNISTSVSRSFPFPSPSSRPRSSPSTTPTGGGLQVDLVATIISILVVIVVSFFIWRNKKSCRASFITGRSKKETASSDAAEIANPIHYESLFGRAFSSANDFSASAATSAANGSPLIVVAPNLPPRDSAPLLSPYAPLTTLLKAAAPIAPFGAGLALQLLVALLKQLGETEKLDAGALRLRARLERLRSLVAEVASDAAFVECHGTLFDTLLATLRAAESCLARLCAESRVRAFFTAGAINAELAALEQELSTRLQEFTVALQASTLAAARGAAAASAAAPVAPQLLPPPFSMSLSLADFELDPPLSAQLATAPRGTFGVVVFGTWTAYQRPVAIKLLSGVGERGVHAWLGEADLMRRLSTAGAHGSARHVVQLFGIGVDDPFFLVVMERMAGGSLRATLDEFRAKGAAPPLAVALRWAADAARGIAYCHAQRVVHADVKAANTLLANDGGAKLGDLGSARVTRGIAATATRDATHKAARGSILWNAPELLEDLNVAPSAASDVYAWAILVWEILSLCLPYHDASGNPTAALERLSVCTAIVRGSLRPDVALVRPDAPPALLALMARAWASDAAQRLPIDGVVREMEGICAAHIGAPEAASPAQKGKAVQ